MAPNDFDPDLNHLGRELRGLTPRSCPIDRDAVMFRAGQSSVPRNWIWPVLTAFATCVAVTFGAALLVQPGEKERYSTTFRSTNPNYPPPWPRPSEIPEAPGLEPLATTEEEPWPVPDTNYYHTQNNVLRWGLDGVPLPPATVEAPRTEKRDMLLRSF